MPIPVMNKNQLDNLWQRLNILESKGLTRGKEALNIRFRLELNARRVVWNNRGIKIIDGGRLKEVA